MSHQRHWGSLTAMPRRMIQPAVIHVSCGSQADRSAIKETMGKDRQRNYKHFKLWDPGAFKTLSVLVIRYQEKAIIPDRIHKMQNIRLL